MKRKHLAKYILGMALFGSNGIVANGSALSSIELVFMRSLIGAASLLIICFAAGYRLKVLNCKRDHVQVRLALNFYFPFPIFFDTGKKKVNLHKSD